MMKDIKIPGGVDYTLYFNLSSQQLDTTKCGVYLIICTSNGFDYSIKCKKDKDTKWSALVHNSLSLMDKQKYRIEVQFDEMIFVVANGNCIRISADSVTVDMDPPSKVVEAESVNTIESVPPEKEIHDGTRPTSQTKPTFSIFSTPDRSKELQTLLDRKHKVRDILTSMQKG